MTNEELLKPERYKLLIEYPDCPFKEGDILNVYCDTLSPFRTWYAAKEKDAKRYITGHPQTFEKVFKKLVWYEERAIEDLPKYVLNKTAIPKTILEVTWVIADDDYGTSGLFAVCNGSKFYPNGLLPATEQEFLNQPNLQAK